MRDVLIKPFISSVNKVHKVYVNIYIEYRIKHPEKFSFTCAWDDVEKYFTPTMNYRQGKYKTVVFCGEEFSDRYIMRVAIRNITANGLDMQSIHAK